MAGMLVLGAVGLALGAGRLALDAVGLVLGAGRLALGAAWLIPRFPPCVTITVFLTFSDSYFY